MARTWLRRRATIVLVLVVVLLIVAAWALPGFIKGYQQGLLTGIHDSCVSSATETAQARGVDVAQPDIAGKIERYCGCVADAVKSGNLTATELGVFSANPQAADPAATKARQVIATCMR